jgi:type IV pilus assembly protein PilV
MHINRQHKRCAGFATLDALAALMLLNLLCLGVLAGQLQALQAQRDALAMQTAVALAQDLWERMQINPQAALSYQLQLGQTVPALDCQSRACSLDNWAQADLAAWLSSVKLRLPGAQTQLLTNSQAQVQLLLAWPISEWLPRLDINELKECPAKHRCWQTRWTL